MSGHGGDLRSLAREAGCGVREILDFSANINPIGPPSAVQHALRRSLDLLVHYPDPWAGDLARAVARDRGCAPESLVFANGTSDLLYRLPALLDVTRAVIPVPAYIDYGHACSQAGLPVHWLELEAENHFALDLESLERILTAGDLCIIGQPNNPTGQFCDPDALLDLVRAHAEVHFLVDEAFVDFVEGGQSVAGRAANLITLCSLTKILALPGLRLGYLVAESTFCQRLRSLIGPWAVNSLAQAAGLAAVGDEEFFVQARTLIQQERARLFSSLQALPGVTPVASRANFILVRLDRNRTGTEARALADRLLHSHRIAIRVCDNYQGLDDSWFRVAVRTAEDNARLLAGLEEVLGSRASMGSGHRSGPDKTPALMLLGTGSDVGKSVLVAALGRIFLQDGLRVAPFKAQNMSLNSHVTRDGGEMGRAQVVQAQACLLDPDVRMNPILLKPNSETGSQVIVLGKPMGNLRVREYVAKKPELWCRVCQAYDELAAEHDVMLLEGAGSPGEVNLRSHDLVNTRMARHAGASMLLVGDIDRGGVYASFLGHWLVMEGWERALLAGFLVNRFRGDATLLADAHDYLRQSTGLPVFGVIPYLDDLGLPQEDSVAFKAGLFAGRAPSGPHVEVAVIDLPHISNFTDIEPLLAEPDVHVRIVARPDELHCPQAVIIPGSKNVAGDMAFLRRTGLDKALVHLAGQGVELVGICGGYQMLGGEITDPYGIEGPAGSICSGLGLLSLSTELARDKTLVRKTGRHLASGKTVRGYEIHHGRTSGQGEAVLAFTDGSRCGRSRDDRIWGCYLHGLFDADDFRRWWINRLREKRGLAPLKGPGARYDLDAALDRLADVVRSRVDMTAIYRLLGL